MYSVYDIWIGQEHDGAYREGSFRLSCVQLYDYELTVEQMDKAAELCDHSSNSKFTDQSFLTEKMFWSKKFS